jgi:hypothetical protein
VSVVTDVVARRCTRAGGRYDLGAVAGCRSRGRGPIAERELELADDLGPARRSGSLKAVVATRQSRRWAVGPEEPVARNWATLKRCQSMTFPSSPST